MTHLISGAFSPSVRSAYQPRGMQSFHTNPFASPFAVRSATAQNVSPPQEHRRRSGLRLGTVQANPYAGRHSLSAHGNQQSLMLGFPHFLNFQRHFAPLGQGLQRLGAHLQGGLQQLAASPRQFINWWQQPSANKLGFSGPYVHYNSPSQKNLSVNC